MAGVADRWGVDLVRPELGLLSGRCWVVPPTSLANASAGCDSR